MMSVEDVSVIKKPNGLGIRHLQTLLCFFAVGVSHGVRNNMSMAIVAMTDTSLENSFDWSMQVQSIILSSFFWGYIILQIPAGELSVKFGGKSLVLIAITTNAVISFLIPVGARHGGWQLVCACRVILGLTQGLVTPAVYTLIGKWAPLEEKSFHLSAIASGNQIGTAIQILTTGFIAAAWGWPMIFYVNGITASIFVLTYLVVGADSPRSSRFISDQERLFIEKSLVQRETPKKLKTPWKAIWTSIPFLTLIVSHCAHNWGYWTLMNGTPSYMKLVHNVDTKANGVMSALPYLTAYIMTFVFGYFSDYFINKKILKLNAARKISNSIALYAPAIALVALCYVSPGDTTMGVALITVTVGLNIGRLTGFLIVHLDMSSNFAGTLIGITNMFASIMSIVTPLATGLILKDETNIMEWRIVFYITAAIFFIGNTQFLIFGTSARQPWDKPVEEKATDAKPEKQMEYTV